MEPIGGDKIIRGSVFDGCCFQRSDDPTRDEPRVSIVWLRADGSNRPGHQPEECFIVVSLIFRETEDAAAFQRVQAALDENGTVHGMYLEFKGLTTDWEERGREKMEVTEVQRAEPKPAGYDWAERVCPGFEQPRR